MKTIKLCRECGKPLESDTPLGLCPECLMKAGLPASANPTIAVSPDAFVEGADTETKEFVPGTKLGYFGDYELLAEIARGGMGVVYKARQTSLKRIVAVKMIRSGALADETEVTRFRTEAQAAAQLQHPNIVAIHEIGEHEGRHYFSMDFVEGKNLAQIAGGRPVSPQSAAVWLKAIAGAAHYAHQRGVLHRDLKPQNIMVDAEGRPRVADFGLAKMLSSDSALTRTDAVMGSPSYMSPEQARGRNDLVGPASDVYALGAILYELLTGRPPFQGKTQVETLSKVVNDEVRPPRKWNRDAPVDLETICLKCLEKEPVRRYPTARELELDLGRFLAGEAVQARPASGLRKLRSWSKRHRWQFNVALSVLILTLMGLAYGLWEETKYLKWMMAHPGSPPDAVRALGREPIGHFFDKAIGRLESPENDSLTPDLFGLYWCEWMLCGMLLPLVKLGFRKLTPMGRPAASWVALTFGAIAAAGVVLALYLTANVIEYLVWSGESLWSLPEALFVFFCSAFVYPLFAWWLSTLLEIIRQQRRKPVDPGLESEEAGLMPEELAPIHAALAKGKILRAAKRYRAATRVPFYEAFIRVLDMAAKRVSPEQRAAFHEEIFAGRIFAAVKLFRAATRMPKFLAHQAVMRIAKQLYEAHPEKFPSGKPGGIKVHPAARGWRWLGIILPLGMIIGGIHVTSSSPVVWLLVGLGTGAFIRIARWRELYCERRRDVRVLACFLVVLTGLGISLDAAIWVGILIHPDALLHLSTWPKWDPWFQFTYPYTPGVIIGWLLMHLRLRRRTAL